MATPKRCLLSDAEHLLSPGWEPRKAWDWLARHLLPVKWYLAGTPAEEIPRVTARAEAFAGHLEQDLVQATLPVWRWAPATKETVQRLFYLNMKKTPEQFAEAIQREAPEAMAALPFLQNVLESIRLRYVADGVLRPEQKFINYFSVVRDKLAAKVDGTVRIEKGEGYVPQTIANLINPRDPMFAKKRSLWTEADFPGAGLGGKPKINFDETLMLYFKQFARHQATREVRPELETLLQASPPEVREYAARAVNHWLGNERGSSSPLARGVRDFEFLRTIGFSVLSPLVNTFQRMNTFAVVRNSAFLQALGDVNDPARVALAKRFIAPNVWDKLDISETVVGGGPVSRFAQKLKQAGGYLFSASEEGNRVHAFLAGLREAEARGFTGDQAAKFAEKVMTDTQFIHTAGNRPQAFRSEFGRTIGQFQTFRLNQTHFLARLTQEAIEGAKSGDTEVALSSAIPLVKFLSASLALGGGGSILFGDWGEEKLTRAALGRAMNIPGIPEMLFGVSLKNQMGLGALNADDLRSFLFFLPGPAATHAQALLGTVLGKSMGRGFDLSDVGRDLSYEEQQKALMQSMPGGLQVHRIVNMLRLLQSNGEYRRAMDLSEVLGLNPAQGELVSNYTAKTQEVLLSALGFTPAGRLDDIRKLERERELQEAHMRTMSKAAAYVAVGDMKSAQALVDTFNRKYGPEGAAIGSVSAQSIRRAERNRLVPPGKRIRPPADLAFSEPFTQE